MDGRLDDAITARRRARVLLSAREVAAAYERMARSIAAALAEENPVVLAVMNGGAFTAIELCRRFDFPYEFAYVHATRYGNTLTGGSLDWHVEPRPELEGRTVLVVDDILDVGLTLAALEHALHERRVRAIYKAVFAIKALQEPLERPAVDFAGTEVEDVYVFGCGMDYRGYWRGVPELLAVASEHVTGDDDDRDRDGRDSVGRNSDGRNAVGRNSDGRHSDGRDDKGRSNEDRT